MGGGVQSAQQTNAAKHSRALLIDHINTLSNLKCASSSQKKPTEELSKVVLALTKEVKELRSSHSRSGDDNMDKENASPSNSDGHRNE